MQQNKSKKGQVNLLKTKNRLLSTLYFLLIISVLLGINIQNVKGQGENSASILDYYNQLSYEHGNTYICYVLNGGLNNNLNPECVNPEDGKLNLRSPHKFGYNFAGWYTDSRFRNRIEAITCRPGLGIILYAKWSRRVNNTINVENYEYENDSKNKSHIKLLKDCKYSFREDIDIPGMPGTKEEDFLNNYIFSESQCPQGMCVTKDFVLVTSYSEEDECLGEMMVFDKKSGEYLITLGMDPQSHLGGIAFDGENVWVCNSNDNTIERISYDFIQLMAYKNTRDVVDATEVVDIYPVDNTPSCITYHGGRLWIATHSILWSSHMVAYFYDKKENKLNTLSSYSIPSKVQGVAFSKKGEVFLSVSYGRSSSSYIKKYKTLIDLASNPGEPVESIEMPPGSEEIDIVGNNLYVIFESAGQKYLEGTDGKGISPFPIDKILKISLKN